MHKTPEEIEAWLVARLAKLLGIEAQRIDITRPLTRYGLDSIVALELTTDLEDWLEQTMPESLLWDEPSIKALVQYLSGMEALPTVESAPASGAATGAQTVSQLPHLEAAIRQEQSAHEPTIFSAAVEPIAVIGLSCRLPGANTPEGFWQLLHHGIEALTEVPPARWDTESFYDPDPAAAGKMACRVGGFLKDVDLFDPHFFKISPREAAHMDPQQRLLLEVAWEALERSGQAPDKLAGSSTGVFIGISTNDYIKHYYANQNAIDAYTNIGNAHSIAASRISYFLDLRGPSVAIDTACSSSLVAIHLACQSLRSGESRQALAGGVNVMLSPDPTISFSKARMISASGHSRPFDAGADGLVRGEGCALIVLKRLADAYTDGDCILGLIRGSAVNQDGRGNGLTAPNESAQQAVIRQAFKQAGIAPSQLGYVVGQGTGTSLGDAVEIQALAGVLSEAGAGSSQRCALGSVKANIGHLEAAAGVTGIIAALLALQHEEIPPQLNFQQLNPRISAKELPVFIPVTPQPWLKGQEPRFVGVSAFSISGTNAHIVLEEAPTIQLKATPCERPLHLFTLSAQNEDALHSLIDSYTHYLPATNATLPDICFTANTGRAQFATRAAVVADTRDDLLNALRSFNTHAQSKAFLAGNANQVQPKVAFLFSGEGTEYEQMGQELYRSQPVFQAALQQCATILKGDLQEALTSALYPAPDSQRLLLKSIYAQPALFALEYALAQLWRSWGITPDAVLGYGVGAYVAACVAGALSLEDALKLAFERGRLVQSVPQTDHAILVHAPEARVAELLTPFRPQASLMAIIAPATVLIACQPAIAHELCQVYASQGITTCPAPFSYTYRLSASAQLTDALLRAANIVPHEKLSLPFISTFTGELLFPEDRLSSEYWCRQLSEPIRFADSIEALVRQGIQFFLEIGPSSALATLGQHQPSLEHITWLPCISPQQGDTWQTMLSSLGALYVNGCTIDWQGFHAGDSAQRVCLPTYPFQRERCWLAPAQPQLTSDKQAFPHRERQNPLLGRRRVRLEA